MNEQENDCQWSINGRFLTQRVTGVQRYAAQLSQALGEVVGGTNRGREFEIVAPPSAIAPSSVRLPFRIAGRRSGQIWEQFSLPRAASGGVVSLCNTGPLSMQRHIVCIHDANVIEFPQSYSALFRSYYRMLLPMLGRTAQKILTVSKTSADLLVKHGIAPANKIEVVCNGHEHINDWDAKRSTLLQHSPPRRPFALVIGSRAPHKNIQLVHQIASDLDAMGIDIFISGSTSGIFANEENQSAASNVRYLGYVTDHDLADLYSKAECLLFPSFVEGFGLPLVEAMAFGCPIVSSNSSCMPEICGRHALLADPNAPSEWVKCVQQILQGDFANSQNVLRSHMERFSWKRSAQKLASLMRTM